jgi:hypothetical protein
MSLRLYFVETVNIESPRNDGSSNFHSAVVYRHKGETLWHADFEGFYSDIPEEILPYIKEVSFQSRFTLRCKREIGIYRGKEFGDANAEVDLGVDEENEYCISIRGSRIEDVRNLYYAIRAGKFDGKDFHPAESWEAPQGGKSYPEPMGFNQLLNSQLNVADLKIIQYKEISFGILLKIEKIMESKLLWWLAGGYFLKKILRNAGDDLRRIEENDNCS